MASSTISGNVGGASFSGALVQCLNVATKVILFAAADASGNFSFTGLGAGTYIISASFLSYVYYLSVQVVADGVSTFSGINLTPTALSASNFNTQI